MSARVVYISLSPQTNLTHLRNTRRKFTVELVIMNQSLSRLLTLNFLSRTFKIQKVNKTNVGAATRARTRATGSSRFDSRMLFGDNNDDDTETPIGTPTGCHLAPLHIVGALFEEVCHHGESSRTLSRGLAGRRVANCGGE
jgi:hypothetical protein